MKTCNGAFYLEGVGVAAAVGALMWLVLRMVPPSVLDNPTVSVSAYAGWPLSPSSFTYALLREALYVALGEETSSAAS